MTGYAGGFPRTVLEILYTEMQDAYGLTPITSDTWQAFLRFTSDAETVSELCEEWMRLYGPKDDEGEI